MEQFKVLINVVAVTSIIGLAISYLTTLFPILPKLNFLEAVGLYCFWIPIHHSVTEGTKSNKD
jgi:hypothetical protein